MVRVGAVVALALLSAGTFVFVTAESMPIALLTLMAPSLEASHSQIGLLVTGYGVVVAVTSVPLTRLTLAVSRRRLLCGAFVLFVVSLLATALAPNYAVLLTARIATALAHALFWSVIATAATGLFPEARQGRVVAALFLGSSLGFVLGVPAATWLGQSQGWRPTFAALAGAGLVLLVGLAALLPDVRREDETTSVGSAPDRRQYAVVLATTGLGVAAIFTAQTYVALFLERASGFAPSSLGPTLLVSGVAGLVGVLVAGAVVDRLPRTTVVVSLALSAVSLLAAYPLAREGAAMVVLVCLRGLAISGLATAVQVRILVVAPGSTDLASAASSSMFNVGIASGALLGGAVLDLSGVRETTLAAGAVALVALVVFVLGMPPVRRADDPGTLSAGPVRLQE